MKEIAIIGGGLAGLCSAILLARKGIACTVFEKKRYPFHRVCGEYVSNEVAPFLKSHGIFPEAFNPPLINQLQLSSASGRNVSVPLPLGGFGISRYAFDHFLSEKARQAGVIIKEETEVSDVVSDKDVFYLVTPQKTFAAHVVIGSYGKRSKLDSTLKRKFFFKRSPYVGVKYHIKSDQPPNVIGLHNFHGGYCGISKIENETFNLCYLVKASTLKEAGGISALEEKVLSKNHLLKYIFSKSDFVFNSPETIGEISFQEKPPVEKGILMAGDAAGMITPLCGNGMAVAIHSAKIVSDHVSEFCNNRMSRHAMESSYTRTRKKFFGNRLWVGRQVQNNLFGNKFTSHVAVNLAMYARLLTNLIIRNTHGEPF